VQSPFSTTHIPRRARVHSVSLASCDHNADISARRAHRAPCPCSRSGVRRLLPSSRH
jgi:hypothetical protein